MSCLLFHGPGAKNRALDEAQKIGPLLSPPIGEDGLKVDESRAIKLLLLTVPFQGRQTLVIGPMDQANPKASDALLKSLEEADGKYIQPILWAEEIELLTLTIRSRCLAEFVPGRYQEIEEEVYTLAWEIQEAIRQNDFDGILFALEYKHKRAKDLIGPLMDALSEDFEEPLFAEVWERLRVVAQQNKPNSAEVISALLGGM